MAVASSETVNLETVIRRFNSENDIGLMSPLNAMKQCAWVYAATTFISEAIMRTDFVPFSGDERVESPEIEKLIERPNSYSDQDTSGKFRYSYMMELLLHGAVIRLFNEMSAFKPMSMSVRPRWHYTVEDGYDDFGRCVPVRWRTANGRGRIPLLEGDNFFHDTLYNPYHPYEGLAPLVAAAMSVLNDVDASEFLHRFFVNDGSTGIVFTTEDKGFKQPQAVEAAKAYREAYSGVKNAHSAKFVGFGLIPHKVGTPLDANMLKIVRTFTKEEIISGIYKIPLAALSANDNGGDIVIGGPSGGSQASANESFFVNVVMPWAQRFDDDFNRDVTWRFDTRIKMKHDFSTNPILERRRFERARACAELIDRGVPLNEVIRWLRLGLALQPHGEEFWIKNDRLPASVVMAQGDGAIKIAIPDQQKPKSTKAQETYVDEITELAQTSAVLTSLERLGDKPVQNGNRIRDLCFGLLSGSLGNGRHPDSAKP